MTEKVTVSNVETVFKMMFLCNEYFQKYYVMGYCTETEVLNMHENKLNGLELSVQMHMQCTNSKSNIVKNIHVYYSLNSRKETMF